MLIHRPCSLANTLQSWAATAEAGDNPKLAQNRCLGIVIVDHGSRKAEANETLNVFGDLFARSSRQDIVEVAHMELAEPTIADAIHACVRRGATHVVVAPYFLSRGRHVQSDIPRLVEEAQAAVPDTPIRIAEPIGAARQCAMARVQRISLVASAASRLACMTCVHAGIDMLMAQLINNRVNAAAQMFN